MFAVGVFLARNASDSVAVVCFVGGDISSGATRYLYCSVGMAGENRH